MDHRSCSTAVDEGRGSYMIKILMLFSSTPFFSSTIPPATTTYCFIILAATSSPSAPSSPYPVVGRLWKSVAKQTKIHEHKGMADPKDEEKWLTCEKVHVSGHNSFFSIRFSRSSALWWHLLHFIYVVVQKKSEQFPFPWRPLCSKKMCSMSCERKKEDSKLWCSPACRDRCNGTPVHHRAPLSWWAFWAMIGCWLPWVAGWMGPCPASRGCRIRQTRTVPPVSCACASRRWHIRAAHIWCPDNCILPKAPSWPVCFLLLLLRLSLCVCVWPFLRNGNNPPQLSVFIHTENDTPSVCVCVCARNPNLQTKYLTTTTTTRDTSSRQAINEYTRTITRDSFAEDLEQEKNYPTNDKRQQPEATTKLATDTPQQQQQQTLGASKRPINKLHHNNSQ